MKVEDIEGFHSRILAERDELQALCRATTQDRAPVELDQQSVGRLSRMDAMRMQAMAEASDRRRKMQIQRLEQALRRIENGEFGYCQDCGEAIADGRLAVDPAAHLCIACARGITHAG